jgi:hypothetical protein
MIVVIITVGFTNPCEHNMTLMLKRSVWDVLDILNHSPFKHEWNELKLCKEDWNLKMFTFQFPDVAD